MSDSKTNALAMLHSADFFNYLRETMRGVGLAEGEEKFGMGVYFVATSRILQNPLRLSVLEKTEGSANFIVRRVAKLLQPDCFVEITPRANEAWSRFEKNPQNKLVYISDSTERRRRLEVAGIQLSRVTEVVRERRIEEKRENVTAPFACISADYQPPFDNASRFLTMRLKAPQVQTKATANSVFNHATPPDEERLSQWHRVQELVMARGQMRIVLPDWADLVVEEICKNERAARHLPAFLQAWKTMAVLRSFLGDEKTILRQGEVRGDFADFAATGLFLRGAFREGHWFPSIDGMFKRVMSKCQESALLHPLTGKGIRYSHRTETPARRPLL